MTRAQPEKRQRNMMVKAWQTVHMLPELFEHFDVNDLFDHIHESITTTPALDHKTTVSTSSFYHLSEEFTRTRVATSQQHNLTDAHAAAKPPKSTSSFWDPCDDEEDDDYSTAACPLAFTNTHLVFLADNLQFSFPGLPDVFQPGYQAILKLDHETEVDFAIRRLSAILSPLLDNQDISRNSPLSLLTDAINHWHSSGFPHAEEPSLPTKKGYIHSPQPHLESISEITDPVERGIASQNTIERALAETAFYYDAKSNRLIIRHAPTEEDTKIKAGISKARQKEVTNQILVYLALQNKSISEQKPTVFHITPTRVNFRVYPHMVTVIESEATKRRAYLDSKDHLPSVLSCAESFCLPENYHFLGLQKLTDELACGIFATMTATIATQALCLTNQTLETLTLQDFKQYPELWRTADITDTDSLKMTLQTMRPSETLRAELMQKEATEPLFSQFTAVCAGVANTVLNVGKIWQSPKKSAKESPNETHTNQPSVLQQP